MKTALYEKKIIKHWITKLGKTYLQTWGDYNPNVIDFLPHARLRLRMNKITMQSITITLKVVAITFVARHPQKENKAHLHGTM